MPHYALIGTTGLIGSHILQELLNQPDSTITVLVRKPIQWQNPRINEILIDFSDEQSLIKALTGCETVFVATGTTQKKVKGDRAAYRKVDHDIPIAVAKACIANSIPRILIVSSVGANSRSKNFYLRIKGEVEDTIAAMPIPYISFFQPSLLLGDRQEFRLGEKISQIIYPKIDFLLPARYRSISAAIVAKAMIRASAEPEKGLHRYMYSSMMERN
jgi:uncharacterized protein YbjT (DUF2867 family)